MTKTDVGIMRQSGATETKKKYSKRETLLFISESHNNLLFIQKKKTLTQLERLHCIIISWHCTMMGHAEGLVKTKDLPKTHFNSQSTCSAHASKQRK